ncbi:type II toxin-antitoxin system HicA family toxin [Devosia rhizoryzae]|uniref:Type II toxin-antitoxin system HicA family toxin n=1 Tax=Devosia rhizoryzae TaxID=2774137 RepID=A0ABX7C6U7_9HYPH|nr:type II toxin-antitoxin system HicA family toxin [Devosia rhizoryzae]QQR39979.1 type II toxin-antitoxin system HicA family toxin [Devosia rhizoryzae]
MTSISGKEFARMIEAKGWVSLRISGSHHIYGKVGVAARISLPIHGNTPFEMGLLRHLARLAEIPENEWR